MKAQMQQFSPPSSPQPFGCFSKLWWNSTTNGLGAPCGDKILNGVKCLVGCFILILNHLTLTVNMPFSTNFCGDNEVCESVTLYMYLNRHMICCLF